MEGHKSIMGGSRSGIMVRSTCERVNSTDAIEDIDQVRRVLWLRRYHYYTTTFSFLRDFFLRYIAKSNLRKI